MEKTLQHQTTTFSPWLPTASTENHRTLAGKATYELTFRWTSQKGQVMCNYEQENRMKTLVLQGF